MTGEQDFNILEQSWFLRVSKILAFAGLESINS